MNDVWHNLKMDDIMQQLASSQDGLSSIEATSRLTKYGYNQITGKKRVHPLVVFFRQFLNPLIYVLVAAVIIKMIAGGYVDAIVILGVLFLMATIGFIQESKAEKAMEALLELAAPRAKVRRDGKVKTTAAKELVPGDIIILDAGDKVPADARLLELSNLKVNEATLTGESMPVDKHTDLLEVSTAIADRKNMVFMGTAVTYGRTSAIVTATGMTTEMGKIATAIHDVKTENTPLQKSISKLSRYILVLVLAACAILVAAGIIEGLPAMEVVLLAVAAAVSAIPEGLPATVTVTLALGMRAMAQRNALIRKLVAVETLGAATVICSDKTGTLTLNQMTVKRVFVDGKRIEVSGEGYATEGQFLYDKNVLKVEESNALKLLLEIGVLCNDALLTHESTCCDIIGDPTEGALVVSAAKGGLNKEGLEQAFPRIDEIPFQSEKQYMATLHTKEGHRIAYVKGSPERLLAYSKSIFKNNSIIKLNDEEVRNQQIAIEEMAKEAMRVLGLGYAELPAGHLELKEEDIKGNLIFVGLVGMADPPREEAKKAIRMCKQAGIKVVMITGDNLITAGSVARQLELPAGKAITGNDLQRISDEDLSGQIMGYSVFARIEPLHKLRIVNAFKNKGQVVAMTGDGVNDAPALKSASIGVSMGITGTDVAKEASDIVLSDDNFASVVTAVEEGRAIFNRLRNVTLFLLTTGFGELLTLILCVSFLGLAPLVPLQIIWINLITGALLAIPLGVEPKTGEELKQPPRDPKVGLVFPGFLMRLGFLAGMLCIGVFLVFNWAQSRFSLDEARTITFCAVVVFEWLVAFNARSDEATIFRLGVFRNIWMVRALILAIVLQMAVIYLPFMQIAFKTVAMSAEEWAIAIIPGVVIFCLETLRKQFFPNLFSVGKWRRWKQ